MAPGVVVEVEGLAKRYGLPWPAFVDRVRRRLLRRSDDEDEARAARPAHDRRPNRRDRPWALRDVDLAVERGEILGVVGRNGAGKSTLLKVLASVTPPTRGRVAVRGRVFPMIELNAGVHPELSGRENLRFLSGIMGLPRRQLRTTLAAIEAFSELADWLDRPVRTYSTGMLARLGFAVAVHAEADVLLVDEVLSVGDLAFQRKCVRRVEDLAQAGAAVILVSHNLYLVERLCRRTLVLDRGAPISLDTTQQALAAYFNLSELRLSDGAPSIAALADQPSTAALLIERVAFMDIFEQELPVVGTADYLRIRIFFRVDGGIVPGAGFWVRFYDPEGTLVLSLQPIYERFDLAEVGHVDCDLRALPLMPNRYDVEVGLLGAGTIRTSRQMASLVVAASPEVGIRSGNRGIAYAHAYWSHGRPAVEQGPEAVIRAGPPAAPAQPAQPSRSGGGRDSG